MELSLAQLSPSLFSFFSLREAFEIKKEGTLDWVQSGNDPTWDFIEMG